MRDTPTLPLNPMQQNPSTHDEAESILALLLSRAEHTVVLTGAGVSAESGVPTFRDAQTGLWAKYDPTELATPHAYARDPALVTRWYDDRRSALAQCKPNPGHHALTNLQQYLESQGRSITCITQNVDRLHHDAGTRDIIELHGSLWEWRCCECGAQSEDREIPFKEHPPRCADCGGPKRPGVVWFGENLPIDAIDRATHAASNCDLFLSVGTSSLVHPAAGLIQLARANSAMTCEINPNPTPESALVDLVIAQPSGNTLPGVVRKLQG